LKHVISVIPGDGIGPEVIQATLRVLEKLAEDSSMNLEYRYAEAGDAARSKYGVALPDESFNTISSSDACLKGPIGESAKEVVIPLRQRLDLYANIRPALTLPNVLGIHDGVDLVIVRENTEGLYKGIENRTDEYAFGMRIVTRRASTRIAKIAYDLAMHRRRKVTIVHKANVMLACRFFSECCHHVGAGYPEVRTEEMYIDNAAYQLVKNPKQFDVILTTNLFGDILSDEAAGIVGSLGISPSMNVGDSFGIFEPVHGSAPDLPKAAANPLATMMSARLMLDWLAEKHRDALLQQASQRLWNAILGTLRKRRALTPDLGGESKTSEVADAVIDEIDRVNLAQSI
jgi:3-isopropylmalate dehydrogenase